MKKNINCRDFKPFPEIPTENRSSSTDCNRCIYFSSRNCGHDIADSIDTESDIF